jgi:hypothetical protein
MEELREAFSLNNVVAFPATPAAKRRSQQFLLGPLYLEDIRCAYRCGGAALVLWLLIRHRQKLRGDLWTTLSAKQLETFGVSRWAEYRALARLQKAKLIDVRSGRGRSTRVRLRRAEHG